jgi:hypothetical protein
VEPSPDAQLAKEFFSLANIITGFYVAQTLIFLNSLQKATELRTSLSRDRSIGRLITWLFAGTYIIAVSGCSIAEFALRSSAHESTTIRLVVVGSGVGRVSIILILGGLCQFLLSRIKPAVEPAA